MKETIWLAIVLVLALTLFACSSSDDDAESADSESESETTLAADWTWSESADCSTCHATEYESLTDDSTQICASHGTLACTDCHTDTEALQEAHADVTAEDTNGTKRLKTTEVSADTCLSCHDQEDIIEATADLTVLTDSEGTTVNPHDLPTTTQHLSYITCTDCHDMHSDDTVEELAQALCLSCHHQNVYECYTCHE